MVEILSQEEFDEMWNQKDQKDQNIIGSIVLHYANWCHFSKEVLPSFDRFQNHAKLYFKNVTVSKINYGNESPNKSPSPDLKIKGYPTVIVKIQDKPPVYISGFEDINYHNLLKVTLEQLIPTERLS